MIDLHSHILPGIDDGARSIKDTIAIAKNSIEVGVTHIMCTPHIHLGTFDNDVDSIQRAFSLALHAVRKANLPLKLGIGSEVRITPEILPLISGSKLPFIGTLDGKHLLLLELPHSHVPPGTENLIKWLLRNNVQPVIPHPERNRDIMAAYNKLKWLRQLGCLFQITAGAFVNRFSSRSYDIAWQMLDDGLADYVASDTHNIHKRPNDMGEAFEAITKAKDKALAEKLFISTPAKLTEDIHWY